MAPNKKISHKSLTLLVLLQKLRAIFQVAFRFPSIITDVIAFPPNKIFNPISPANPMTQDVLNLKLLALRSVKHSRLNLPGWTNMRLQKRHMKHWMDLLCSWQLQFVRYPGNDLQNGEGTNPLGAELLSKRRWQLKVASLQPHIIPYCKCNVSPVFVSLLIHSNLTFQEILPDKLLHISPSTNHIINQLHFVVLQLPQSCINTQFPNRSKNNFKR